MASLSAIKKGIENNLGVTVYGEFQQSHFINGIRFITKEDADIAHLEPNVLYLADFGIYGNDTFYGDVLFTNLGDEKIPEPHLAIRENIDLIRLYHTIEDTFLSYRHLEYQKQTLFHTLLNGMGIDALLKTSYNYLNNPITLCDSTYTVVSTYPEEYDEEHLEYRNRKLSLKEIFSNNMVSHHITEKIYHSIFPFATTIFDSDNLWIFQSVRIRNAVIGYICVRCIERDYTEADLELIHFLTMMISIQLQKDDSYRNPQSLKYDLFLKELFARYSDDDELITKQLMLLGVKPKAYYCLILCGFINNGGKLMAYHYYLQQLSSIFPNSISGVFGNRLATLISTPDLNYMSASQKYRFETFLTMNRMLATVSYVYDSPKESSAYFAQCNMLLSQQLMTYNEYPIIYYQDHYLAHMIGSIKNKELPDASIHPSIKMMLKYDEKHHTNYYHTLKTFFSENRNAQATANKLFIHKSTLFYRFDKMKQLFDIDMDNADTLFSYEYSIHVLQIRERK